jgi:uncharacterized protein
MPNSILLIDGPSGKLEAMYNKPKTPATACGVICHPDPQQEGTMHNKVVTAISWAMEAMGWATLRFNYRGIGSSEGSYGHIEGEIDDGRAACEWLKAQNPGLPMHVAGFSFGAFIASTLATEFPVESLVTAAPVVSRGNYHELDKITCPWLAVVGEEDELVSVDAIHAFKDKSGQDFQLTPFPKTTHFFHGQLIPLRESIKAFYQGL